MSRREKGRFGLTAVDCIVALLLFFVLWMAAVRDFPRLDRKVVGPVPTATTAAD